MELMHSTLESNRLIMPFGHGAGLGILLFVQ